MTQRHIPEEWNPKPHRCEMLKARITYGLKMYLQISFHFPEHWFLPWSVELSQN
jgi:hypothetical protein